MSPTSKRSVNKNPSHNVFAEFTTVKLRQNGDLIY